MRLPSGLNATEVTSPECPSSVATHSPVAAFHTRTVVSSLPDAMRLPSGLNATEFTWCPLSGMRTSRGSLSVFLAMASHARDDHSTCPCLSSVANSSPPSTTAPSLAHHVDVMGVA